MHPIETFLRKLHEIDTTDEKNTTDYFVTFLEGKVGKGERRLLYYVKAYGEDPSIFDAPDDIKLEEKDRLFKLAQEYQSRLRRLAIIKGKPPPKKRRMLLNGISKHLGQPMLF